MMTGHSTLLFLLPICLQKTSNSLILRKNIFEYTQFLLDDDDNLTKTGNLNKPARDLLRKRSCELLDITDSAEDDALESDANDC